MVWSVHEVAVAVFSREGQSQQETADKLGVDQKTVSNDLAGDVRNFPNVPPATRTNSRGQECPTTPLPAHQRTSPRH